MTAIMIISIGMTIQTIYSDFEIFIDDHFMSPPTLMVAIGILLLFVSSFGCVGAIKESTMLINVVSRLCPKAEHPISISWTTKASIV